MGMITYIVILGLCFILIDWLSFGVGGVRLNVQGQGGGRILDVDGQGGWGVLKTGKFSYGFICVSSLILAPVPTGLNKQSSIYFLVTVEIFNNYNSV